MQFKNTLWAVFALLSAALWAPQANAIPAFARQVGMACSACHFQHFPVLNSFGRAFKEGGYTMIGAQDKIEDPTAPGVSIPAVLNAALVGYIQEQKTNGPDNSTGPTGKTTNNGSLQIPQQVSLFLGGRANEHVGFEAEINLTPGSGGTGTGGAGLIRYKVPFVYDVGNVKAGVVPFSTPLGAADSFEVMNTGAVAVHAFNQTVVAGATTGGIQVISAQQYIGTATNASGVALIASNDNFFANLAKWGANSGAGNSGSPTSNYLRAAWTTGAISGFDSAIGFQVWNGTSAESTPTVNPTTGVVDTKASAIDAQMMGDVGGMPLLLIASYANAPASSGANPNLFNTSGLSKKSLNFGAELGVIPGVATVQLGLRRANSGGYVDGLTAASGNATDNAIMIGATYSIALNIRAELTFTKASGDMYNAANAAAATTAGSYFGTNMTTFDVAFAF